MILEVMLEVMLETSLGGFHRWGNCATTRQIWIIKIVATFLYALGHISLQRRSELLDLKDVAVHMVYW